jgi:hypothetical protein
MIASSRSGSDTACTWTVPSPLVTVVGGENTIFSLSQLSDCSWRPSSTMPSRPATANAGSDQVSGRQSVTSAAPSGVAVVQIS